MLNIYGLLKHIALSRKASVSNDYLKNMQITISMPGFIIR